MLNTVILMGRIGNNLEMRQTNSGTSVLSFTIACDRDYAPQGEEKQTDWIECVAWKHTAEFVSKYFAKGNRIIIEGTIQTRTYDDKNGNHRKATEVVVNKAHFADSKTAPEAPADDFKEIPIDDDLPF